MATRIKLDLFDPYDKQVKVIQGLLDPSIKNVLCLAGRRVGKSTIAENMALYWAAEDRKSVV